MTRIAYTNSPLPIGYGQTISQPYIVALMTDLLDPQPSHRVLEVGAGSGFQAAVRAELVAQVYTVEIVEAVMAITTSPSSICGCIAPVEPIRISVRAP